MNKWTRLWEKCRTNGTKKENMIVIILIGVLLFIIAIPTKENSENKSVFLDSKNAMVEEEEKAFGQEKSDLKKEAIEYADYMAARLEEALSQVENAGKVKVVVAVKSSAQQIVEKDHSTSRSNTTETDSGGGSRSINNLESSEETLYITDAQGNRIPYVTQVFEPEITGIMIVAQGAGKQNVNSDITKAVQALFGIEAHKISIAKMKTE